MPPVLTRSTRKVQILQAAGRLFAYQGYHATSTRQIAHLAKVSENTIFRHFNNKEDLFWATLRAHSAPFEFDQELLEKIANCEPPEVILPKVLEVFSDTASYRPELIRLIGIAFLEMHARSGTFILEHLSPTFAAIQHYLERSIKGGKMRPVNPNILMVALTMTTLTYPEISRLVDKDSPLVSHLGRNRAHAQFWLEMLAPANSPGLID